MDSLRTRRRLAEVVYHLMADGRPFKRLNVEPQYPEGATP